MESNKDYLNNNKPFRCEGIQIKVAAGTQFGFYITANVTNAATSNQQLYSQAQLNQTSDNGDYYTYAATYHNHEKGEFYLTFEDWTQRWGQSDLDFNDLVVRIDDSGNEMTIVDEEEEDSKDVLMEYIVAYEDLGTNDFDFNDVVVGFSHDNKQNEAYIRVLAVGGTLPVYLKGQNDGNEEYLFGQKELHELLGGSTNRPIISHNLNIVQKLPTQIQDGNGYSITEHFKHFKVEVHRKSGIATEISIPDTEKNTGDAPQAFVVADPAWIWPNESQFIGDKYPNFIDWIENNLSEEGANWYGAEWDEEDSANSGGTGGDNTGGGSGEGGEIPNYGTNFINYYNPTTFTANIPYENLPIGTNGVIITLKTQNSGNCSIYYKTNEWTPTNIVSYSYGEANNYRNYPITIDNLNTISNNEYCKDLFIQTYDNNPITELYIKPAE